MQQGTQDVVGGLPGVILNKDNLYEGNLAKYFQVVFTKAQNLNNPYHNFRHMFHVVWQSYQACLFHQRDLTRREVRIILIAAMFHDFNHSGMSGDDDLNIIRAVRGFESNILEEDREFLGDITNLIKVTEYPYKIRSENIGLPGKILRDADMSQALSVAWIQQVVFGLASEWGKKPIEVLSMQVPFLTNLKFYTDWGRETFPQGMIEEKIKEATSLVSLLNNIE